MKRILAVLLVSLAVPTWATHIVGGEFQLLYRGVDPATGHFRYQVGLLLYFDAINGSPGALDQFVTIRIYRKRDNIAMRWIRLSLLEQSEVQYKRPQCSSGSSIRTTRLYYGFQNSQGIQQYLMDPEVFDDEDGYYLTWERCCRNYSITNIYSEQPAPGAIYAGQTFYLEFPPLRRNGVNFINSSPTLFRPLSDYACPGRLYTVDFSGIDPDGDSLVYSMATPLNTRTGDAVPQGGLPGPAPYPTVTYRPTFGPANVMRGKPDLSISKTGMLSVIPTMAGLYVFAVKCEEFRDGVKIGEVRRDFQMLVLATCPQASKPVIEAKKKSDTQYTRNTLNVAWTNTAADEERCIDVRVTDPDAATQVEDVEIVAVAVDFESDDLSEILPELPAAKLSGGSAATFSLCFPRCPYKLGTYKVDIVVLNESCGGALMDTIRLDVTVEPPLNREPVFTPAEVDAVVREGGVPFVVNFTATDVDNDDLTLIPPAASVIDFAKYGFTIETLSESPGNISSRLTWNTECEKYDFSVRRDFEFSFVVNDEDECELLPGDTLKFRLKRQIDDFHDPVIEYVPDPTLEKVTLTKKIYETVNFNVRASDPDNDILVLSGEGDEFSLPGYGAVFPTQTFRGTREAPFAWHLDCDRIDLDRKDEFHFYLIVRDNQNICGYNLADTLDVTVNVLPPDNTAPDLVVGSNYSDFELDIVVGDAVNLTVTGTDADVRPQDELTLAMAETGGKLPPDVYTFATSPSFSPVTGTFSWQPDCAALREAENGVNTFQFEFTVTDSRCFTEPQEDKVMMTLRVRDIDDKSADFLPPNVITPTASVGANDYFAMERLENNVLTNILPLDNCAGQFVNITIRNRWGRELFTSTDRNFRWYADDTPSGVYFYVLKYTNREYKGIVSVLGAESESSGNR